MLTFQRRESLASGHLQHPAVGPPQNHPAAAVSRPLSTNSEVTCMTTTETTSSGLIDQQLLDCIRACAECAAAC
jgi:hypothetical protein